MAGRVGRRSKPLPESAEEYRNRKGIAQAFGVKETTIDGYVLSGMPQVEREGKFVYPLSACVQWYGRHQADIATSGNSNPNEISNKDRAELALAEYRETKTATAKGRLVTLDFVNGEYSKVVTAIRAVMDEAENMNADQFVGLPDRFLAQKRLTQLIDSMKKSFHANVKQVLLDDSDGQES